MVVKPTSRELADLTGIGAYDEKAIRVELFRWHTWPASGKQGHMGFISCWCRPVMVEFNDEFSCEVWQHVERWH